MKDWRLYGWNGSGMWRPDPELHPGFARHPVALVVADERADKLTRLLGIDLLPDPEDRAKELSDAFDADLVRWHPPTSHADAETNGGCPVLSGWMRPEAVDESIPDMAWRIAEITKSYVYASKRRVRYIHDVGEQERGEKLPRGRRARREWLDNWRSVLRDRDLLRRTDRNEG